MTRDWPIRVLSCARPGPAESRGVESRCSYTAQRYISIYACVYSISTSPNLIILFINIPQKKQQQLTCHYKNLM